MIRLEVAAVPAAKGSARAILRGGRAVSIASGSDVNARAQASWTAEMHATIAYERGQAEGVRFPDGPVVVAAVFRFAMPKNRLGTGKNAMRPKSSTIAYLTSPPDCDKALRLALDSITTAGTVWRDDAQVAACLAGRVYVPPGQRVGSTILISDVSEGGAVIALWRDLLGHAEDAIDNAKRGTTAKELHHDAA